MKQDQPDKKTVHRCDCGHFHETDDMETITLKIRKGKDCDLQTALTNMFPHSVPQQTNSVLPINQPAVSLEPQIQSEPKPSNNRYEIPGYNPADPKVVKLLNPEEKAKFLKETAIPVEFARRLNPLLKAGIGIDPGDPNFESKGAKEIRRI